MSDPPKNSSGIKDAPSVQLPVPSHLQTAEVKTPQMSPPNAKWNTKNLIPRLVTDATAAIVSAGTVAPLITIIDK